ncbi:HEAT repeat domain-containing protein [Gemmata sp.]|uniref:HEAT repeat domain-containing protein n=1 Tax=Gemmata sp. TaxID=1914242 RepID=UPI003F6F3FFD
MRYLLLLALAAALAGCSKKKPPEPADPDAASQRDDPPGDSTAKDRAYWLTALKSRDAATRREAADELVVWVGTDPETVAALLDMLKDRRTDGAGRTIPGQINSTRQQAADVLYRGGPKGQAALKEKGVAALREGLADPDPVIREHSAFTLGSLGTLAQPAVSDVLKLCNSSDANVQNAAFDALRNIGGGDPVELSALLKSSRADAARLVAEQLARFPAIPPEAVPNLVAGLKSGRSAAVRTACAAALARVGPAAAPAVDPLVKAITDHYPKEADAATAYEPGSEVAYWNALAAIGAPAAGPTAGLLAHTNPHVRTAAAKTLGEIGAPAKATASKLKERLADDFGSVAIEAAVALCRIGAEQDAAVALVKRAMDLDNSVAQAAIEAIPRMGAAGKDLVPAALAKLASENPFARYAAVGVVGTLPPEEAAKYAADLGALAGDKGTGAGADTETRAARDIRQQVAVVLLKLGPAAAPAAQGLGRAIPKETDAALRDQFVEVLLAMGEAARPALPALLDLAADSSLAPDRRAHLFDVLVAIAPGAKELPPLLVKAAGEVGSATRFLAVATMARLDPVPTDVLAKLVAMATTDPKTPARVAAMRSLAAAGAKAKPVRGDLERIAGGTIPEFALYARVALAGIDGDATAVAADARAALADKNAQVRLAAADALFLLGPTPADLPALQRLLGERSDSVREAAARCVGKLGPAGKDAVPQLIRMLDDKDAAVRGAAATALGDVGPAAKDAADRLKQLKGTGTGRKGDTGDPLAGPAAAKALEKILGKPKK